MKFAMATICILAAMFAHGAVAQALNDPMRPPALGGFGPAGASTGPVVDMIVIAPERRYAVIDGQTVTQGSRLGDARVVRIAETEVTLRSAAGNTRVLKLLPQAEKRVVVSPQGERGTPRGEERKK
jgi:MSHA biogenesis protein MshK